MSKITINIPLEIPTELVEAGAIEKYAKKYAGWTATIRERVQVGLDLTLQEVPNPETAEEAGIRYIKELIKNQYKNIMLETANEDIETEVETQFNELFD